MGQERTCSKCGGAMRSGFILDKSELSIWFYRGEQQTWFSGEPGTRSAWTGYLDLQGRERREVVSYCCDECGFLESFAVKQPS